MSEEKEKKYRRIGWIASIAIQVILFLAFYFLIAWREPDPPIPSYGIELSFGIENVGSGEKPVTTRETVEDVRDEIEEQPAETEEFVEETIEETVESTPNDSKVNEVVPEPVVNTPQPVAVEEKVVKTVEEKKPEIKTPVKEETPKEKPKEEVKPLNPDASMSKNSGETNTSSGTTTQPGAQGKKEGSIDGRALMGEQGSSNGASLQMAGWVWDIKPDPKDNTAESGKIVYKITVDDEGYLSKVDLVSSTVSPNLERVYRQAVERLTFTKTNAYKAAEFTTGTITFIIVTK